MADYCVPKTASLSSTYREWNGVTCIDDDITNFCHTNRERYPFLVVEFDQPVTVSGVVIHNRRNCNSCAGRTSNLHVIVTDEYPEVGTVATGMFFLFNIVKVLKILNKYSRIDSRNICRARQ